MADMSLDELLSSSLKSAAEPAASAGVADAIRARVAAGDTGTSVAGSTAPGWGGAARPAWFLPMIGAIGVLAIVLGVLIGGIATGAFLADPVVTEQPRPSATATPTPSATPTPTPTPTPSDPPPPPPPPRDQTPPVIDAGKWNPDLVYGTEAPLACDRSSDITVTAGDETGLDSVTAATSRAGTQADLVQSGGGDYVFRFSGSYPKGSDVVVNVSFTATDTSGNAAVIDRSITLRGADQCIIIF